MSLSLRKGRGILSSKVGQGSGGRFLEGLLPEIEEVEFTGETVEREPGVGGGTAFTRAKV